MPFIDSDRNSTEKGEREREREGMTCSKGQQVGFESLAAAVRTLPGELQQLPILRGFNSTDLRCM